MTPDAARCRRVASGPGVALILAALGLLACDASAPTAACPLLAPGALVDIPVVPLTAGEVQARISGAGGDAGGRVALAFHAGSAVAITATAAGATGLIGYGPRNVFGGFGHCVALGADRVGFQTTEAGEYLLLVAAAGTGDVAISVERTPTSLAPEAPPCPPLAELGCPAVRCDGELARDDAGCLTCACEAGALCGPERAAGPGGSCVLPACRCAPGEAVCGADGQTWDSACDAECHGVPVARVGACEAVCPEATACERPCFGLRRVDPATSCPTCACQTTFAQEAASCRACPLDPAPVCGSDGRTWLNACRARCAGARILYGGACDPSCTLAPEGCTLDCAHGLLPAAEAGGDCLRCACAGPAPLDCPAFGANACVTLAGGRLETTVGSACVASALGADGGVWGACGLPCADDGACRGEAWLGDAARCQASGFLEGRCLDGDAGPCGCGALVDPVCATSGTTWPNLCRLRCAGETFLHLGACCDGEAPACGAGEVAEHDPRGCPTGACVAAADALRGRGCAENAAVAPACVRDGAATGTSACQAALTGTMAWPEACP